MIGRSTKGYSKIVRKLVILGAAGHIGSSLIRKLGEHKFEDPTKIVCVDDMRTQRFVSFFNLKAKSGTVEFEIVYENANTFVKSLFLDSRDVIINLAAITDAEASVKNPEEVKENNLGLVNEILSNKNIRKARKVFLSSTSVYGSQSEFVDESCSDLKPQSPYAESKIEEERLILSASMPNCVILRLGTIFGVSAGMRFHTAVNKFCFQAANGLPITVWRTAMDQKRPYLGLSDACNAINFFLKHELTDLETFNVVTENYTVRNIIDTISRFESEIKIKFVDSEIMNQLSYEVSSEKLNKLGFRYSDSLVREIEKTLKLLNPKFLKKVQIF